MICFAYESGGSLGLAGWGSCSDHSDDRVGTGVLWCPRWGQSHSQAPQASLSMSGFSMGWWPEGHRPWTQRLGAQSQCPKRQLQ